MTSADLTPEQPIRHFFRVIETPVGAPWDQVRIARLGALHGAPLPDAELVTLVKRLGRWKSGLPGSFAAVSVRRADLQGGAVVTISVAGETMQFEFQQPGDQWRRSRRQILDGLAGVAAVTTLIYTGLDAMGAGADLLQLEEEVRRAAAAGEVHEEQWRCNRASR